MQSMVRIQAAAQAVGLSLSTLRKLEASGEIPRVQRNRSGQRLYSAEDLAAIRRVMMPGQAAEAEPLRILEPKGGDDAG